MIAAIYARKSTDQSGVAEEQKSITRQVESARAYAAAKGWAVDDAHVYVDDGISGAEFANRPGFLRLMNALKPRAPFQFLVMSEESRLGREAIETAYALKQFSQAGVRVFLYLEDRERTLDSPTDKIMLSLTTFADELEREKARQRTRDAMLRKARAGHVTGGVVFGYRNVPIAGADGRRSHVEREIDQAEAAVIRRIFQLSAEGHGVRGIAKILNASRTPAPRPQLGPHSWAPSSVRAVLFRPLYRGEIVWAMTAKRDRWGRKKQAGRPEAEWIRRPAPHLRIVDATLWAAAHARLDASRAMYLQRTDGRTFGRPALGNPSKHLLTNLASCGRCGGSLRARSRGNGTDRAHFYGCSGYHERGRTVCTNNADVPMADADAVVIEALLDDVLDEPLLLEAVDEALRALQGADVAGQLEAIEAELAKTERERAHLVAAIAAGGELPGLLDALSAREVRYGRLQADRDAVRAQRRLRASEAGNVRDELIALANSWRQVLAADPVNARPIVSSLLIGRVTITPLAERKRWELRGEGTLTGLFSREVFPSRWRPQRDSNPRFGLESEKEGDPTDH
ncbi:MAG: recombinase family protein [Acidobacteriia bacterium]|nr:recombinase family protein [Terriglobia bacterium]